MCQPRAAAVVITTFTGTVADAQGVIGGTSPFGAITPGQAYTLTYTIDDNLPGAVVTPGAYGKKVSGGASVKAALTLNGITRVINGQTTALAENKNEEPDSGTLFDRVLRSSQDFSYVQGGLYSDSYA